MLKQTLLWYATSISAAVAFPHERTNFRNTTTPHLRVETFVNKDQSLNMVSSLIIGAEAAVIVDLPLAIPQALTLASWVRNTTDKPLVGAFTTHYHPDHYLSGASFLEQFPGTPFYAIPEAVEHIKTEFEYQAQNWSTAFGPQNIASHPIVPTPFNSTLFTLPGNEHTPIHLLHPFAGDTVDQTLFWLPSTKTLIAGDTVFASSFHLWLADQATPALTSAWLATLSLIADLGPRTIVPGHALSNTDFAGTSDLEYTRTYVEFFAAEVQAKGPDSYTPEEIYRLLDERFPGRAVEGGNAATILNFTSQEFGRGGGRYTHMIDLGQYTDERDLEGWELRKV
ncbi:beta-lactamase-like protein [Boeremia exigua]|uniref:beta-lactamase-like protein n=1 Tax=Boeremia exigua TaxID=749465 RepID=UPI001E8CB86B|nr:beta-lactamase-like protein [Boeremia exigua]KAH6615368.1 beta-lactamase-like protein [Boeremia exigua]